MPEESKTPVRKVDILKKTLSAESINEQFKNALGNNANSFVASIIDLYTGDPQLQTCDPNAVVAQALKAAVLKLPIVKSLGFAYIVVFNNSVKTDNGWVKVPTPTFMPGYKGYVQLAMRTGQYKTMNTDVVYEGEVQKVNKLSGEINFDGKKISDKIVGYFAYFETLNGFSKTLYIDVETMAKHAKRYSAVLKSNKDITVESLKILANSEQSSGSVGWLGNFTDMALKTCLRNLLAKWGYLSVEMQDVLSGDRDSEDERNEAIAEIRTKNLNIENVEFSEVTDEKKEVVPPAEAEIPY
ncbi:MAG: recombinase RecT [Paludibacter sp.]